MNAYNYDSKLHIINNHPKHSLRHAYSHTNEYLGLVSNLNLIGGYQEDSLYNEHDGSEYDPSTGETRYYKQGRLTLILDNVYAQQRVMLGKLKRTVISPGELGIYQAKLEPQS